MKHASANFTAVAGAVAPPISIYFWFLFPAINKWADGGSHTTTELMCDTFAVPLIISGVLLFRKFEHKNKPEEILQDIRA
jgi:hypothetical protein